MIPQEPSMRPIVLFSLAVFGCEPGGAVIVDGSDSDSDVSTPDQPTLGGTLAATLNAPSGEVTFAVMPVTWVEDSSPGADDGGLVVEEAWQTTSSGSLADGAVTFAFDWPGEPPDETFVPTGNNSAEETATFMLGAFVDADESGDRNEGDLLLGATLEYLIYLRGELSDESFESGAKTDSWHLVAYDEAGLASLVVLDAATGYDAWELDPNLLARQPSDLPVTVVDDYGPGVELSLVSMGIGLGDDAPKEVIISTISLDTSGGNATGVFADIPAPPDDHFGLDLDPDAPPDEGPPPGISMAAFLALAWSDNNNDAVLDLNTDPLFGSSHETEPTVMLMYIKPTDFQGVLVPLYWGIDFGWTLIDVTEDAGGPIPFSNGLVITTFQ
jgi:hypothetical protein